MKTFIAALLVVALTRPVWATPAAEQTLPGASETTLNATAHYLDSILAHTLNSLELIAATPEAKGGDWPGIKRYLNQLAATLPGAYFYLLPNGDYFTHTRDFTNLNLSDRPYFRPLFAGNPVRGFPIYSRSSGKKSALMAAPIMVAGKVTGALGVSVFLDELHARLNRELALPAGQTWFVLDADGNTMLDQDSAFIFMNALTQGSRSLQEAVATALKHDRGVMQYDYAGTLRRAHYRKLPTMDWWMILAHGPEADPAVTPTLQLSLDRFVPALQDRLQQLDASLAQQMAQHPVNSLDDGALRGLLRAVINANPMAVNAAFVDAAGVLRQIEPRDYRNFENVDIGAQAHVQALRRKPAPVFSGGFVSVEGFLAVDIAHPLYDRSGMLLGSISVLLHPEMVIAQLLRQHTLPADYELWVMQPDGLIIYDQDRDEMGRMLFNDPIYADYTSLLKLGQTITARASGKGSYFFVAPQSGQKVIKNAVWQTVSLHGQEWRVVLACRPYDER